MSEKLLIITEKPTAAAAFEKALGRRERTFNGDTYAIVNLYGHVLANPVPDKTAVPEHQADVGGFAKIDTIPWDPRWFNFDTKGVKAGSMAQNAKRALNNVKSFLKEGYIPVIASDNDKSGEGDMIVWEVLDFLNYSGKVYREYHVDETEGPIKKALTEKKVVDHNDPILRVAKARSRMDYLTQQMTRVATISLQQRGFKLPAPVPMGRLKSVILTIVGDQQKAIDEFKPSSVFETRYKLGKLVLSAKNVPQFKTKEEWQLGDLPETADVKEVKQVRGTTQPPKAYTLSQLAGAVAKKNGMKAKAFLATYQKMYEAHILSYPRTDDNFISPEQFNEMLPNVDKILGIIRVPTAPFTHRTPRPTHVHAGSSHGALRPGMTLPDSLAALNSQFGHGAADIYQLVAERFLMMFLEDTEWVRHEYATKATDPVFTGSVKIITKQGVPDDDQKDVRTELPDLSKKAIAYAHEVKATKPHKIDSDWLLKQLEKNNVGTGATRVSTLAEMGGSSDKYPLKERKVYTLSPMRVVGYKVAKGTLIRSVEGTRTLEKLIENVRSGSDILTEMDTFTKFIGDDVPNIKGRIDKLGANDLPFESNAPKPKVSGIWGAEEVQFNKVYLGHEWTDDEVQQLLNNEDVTITGENSQGMKVTATVHLAKKEYKGHPYVGFEGKVLRDDQVAGAWNGEKVVIKKTFSGHTFTDEELSTLFAGRDVAFTATSAKTGKEYQVHGKLAQQEYQGHPYVGFKAEFPQKDREGYVTGKWNGEDVSFKKEYAGHQFTDQEIQMLLDGGKLKIDVTRKSGKTANAEVFLAKRTYNGNTFVGACEEFMLK